MQTRMFFCEHGKTFQPSAMLVSFPTEHSQRLAILYDLFGMVKWPFEWLRDLQVED